MQDEGTDNKIVVCTCFDGKIFLAGIVLIQSIIDNSKDYHPLQIFIITSDRSFDHELYFQPVQNIEIETIHIDNKYLELPGKDYITAGTYLRFAIPYVLNRFERVLYLDADIVVNRDLYDLFTIDLQSHPLAATPDYSLTLGSLTWPKWHILYQNKEFSFAEYASEILGIQVKDKYEYFNCGVLLIDIEKWCSLDIVARATTFLSERPDLRYLDQDALSHVISGDFVRLDPRWNAFSDQSFPDVRWWGQRLVDYHGPYETVRKAWRDEPWIAHFAGPRKPWDPKTDRTPLDHLWWAYARKSPAWPHLIDAEREKQTRDRWPPVKYPSERRKAKGTSQFFAKND